MTGFDAIEHACRTDVGVRRSHNQDDYAADPASDPDRFRDQGHLFVVADGMGGHAVGEKASAKAARDIPHTYHKHATEGPAIALRRAFLETNAGIHAIGQENVEFRGLGTTGTALLLRPEGAWVAHVGDSRVYRIRRGVIEQLTFDHSALWEIARRQKVKPEELQGIRSNVILRSLGPDSTVDVDIEGPHPIRPGDKFLMCSDGLTGVVSDYEIGAVTSVMSPAEACDFLVELANLRGGPDNITVLIVRAGKDDGSPDEPTTVAAKPKVRKPVPWPLSILALGILLGVISVMLRSMGHAGLDIIVFVLAAAAVGAGLFGLGLHGQRQQPDVADDGPAELHVYATTRCQIEMPLIEKLGTAVDGMRTKLQEFEIEPPGDSYDKLRKLSTDAVAAGDLPTAFLELCRAMNVLIRSFNSQRQKEEIFSPVWDKAR